MQVAMTERDKKLIVMLAIIVIVVSIGYWGIRPALQAYFTAKEDIVEQEEIKELNDMKIAQIPLLQARTEEYDAQVEDLKKQYLPYMNNDEIDKMFTGMVLERGLFAYDLDIDSDTAPVSLAPYTFSKMATDPYYTSESEEEKESEEVDNSQSGVLASLEDEIYQNNTSEEISENYNDVIYTTHLVLRIGGDLDKLYRFIDDMEAYEKKILITGYRWNESTYISRDETDTTALFGDAPADETVTEETDTTEETVNTEVTEETGEEDNGISLISGHDAEGSYNLVSERILTLELDVFMYKDSE